MTGAIVLGIIIFRCVVLILTETRQFLHQLVLKCIVATRRVRVERNFAILQK